MTPVRTPPWHFQLTPPVYIETASGCTCWYRKKKIFEKKDQLVFYNTSQRLRTGRAWGHVTVLYQGVDTCPGIFYSKLDVPCEVAWRRHNFCFTSFFFHRRPDLNPNLPLSFFPVISRSGCCFHKLLQDAPSDRPQSAPNSLSNACTTDSCLYTTSNCIPKRARRPGTRARLSTRRPYNPGLEHVELVKNLNARAARPHDGRRRARVQFVQLIDDRHHLVVLKVSFSGVRCERSARPFGRPVSPQFATLLLARSDDGRTDVAA